jgi:hypothetical protein
MNLKLRNILSDPEFWLILGFNGLFVYLYQTKQLDAGDIIWIYFIQSLFIGLQYVIRMLAIARRSEEKGRWTMTLFFLLHYGGFHFVYLIFLSVITATSKEIGFNTGNLFPAMGLLTLNLLFSTRSDIISDKEAKLGPGNLFFIPYLRIAPMHLFIILGFNGGVDSKIPWLHWQDPFLIFIVLKTFSDIILHILVNKTYQGRRPRSFRNIE